MKKIIRNLCIFMSAVLFLSVFLPVYAMGITASETSITKTKDKKIYSNATIEQDFVDNHIIVVMDKSISSVNKQHTLFSSRSLSIGNVKDLTYIEPAKLQTKTDISASSKAQLDIKQNMPLLNTDEFRQILLLELPVHSKTNVLETIKELEAIDGIMYAGPDYITSLDSSAPNDRSVNHNWAIDKIQLEDAWDITTGSDTIYVGVIDSGIASHPDLNDNVVAGWDFYHESSLTTDDTSGHGTAVASIIGAVSNSSQGVSGVAQNVKLVPLQVTYDGSHSLTSDRVEAITYAVNHNIPILNYSRGMMVNDEYIYNHFDELEALKIAIANYNGLFVCSAGNDGEDTNDTIHLVSEYKLTNMISVANSNCYDLLDATSNYGDEVIDLAAPGEDIYCCGLNSNYITDGGTSLAAPFVTGVAVLIKSIRPELSAKEIKALILNNVTPVDALLDKCVTGGRLNAYQAVRAATESQTFTGDVNGDGKADVILSRNIDGSRALTVYLGQSNGSFSEPITTEFTEPFYYDENAFVGDFNGDGLTDVVVQRNNWGYRQLLVYRSKGDGKFYEGVSLSSSQLYILDYSTFSFHVADINGDNRDDFIVTYESDSGNRNALVYMGTSSSPYLLDATTNALESNNAYDFNDLVYMGDFNGDGRADMLVHWVQANTDLRQLRVYLGNTDGTFSTGAYLSATATHYPAAYPVKLFVADVDGDGRDDLVINEKNTVSGISIVVYKGKAESPYLTNPSSSALVSSVLYNETDPVFMGDINNDGKSDMIVHSVNSSGYRELHVFTASTNGTYNQATTYNTWDEHSPKDYAERVLLADVNGDGRDDLIVKSRELDGDYYNVHLITYRGTSAGSFESAVSTNTVKSVVFYNSYYFPSFEYELTAGTYKIINVGANKCLNVYGDNVTVLYNQQNVCLWEDSGTNEQRWYVTGGGSSQFIKSVIDLNFGLNVYRAGNPWNCDLYPIAGNETDSLIDFIETDGGYKIKLHNYDLYLTAASYTNGANVYWGAASTSTYQLWNLFSA